MNPNAPVLAQNIFLKAVQPGPSHEPAAVAAILVKLQAEGDGIPLNVGELEDALDEEFPWRNQLVFQSREPEFDELAAWTAAVRWLMQSLLQVDGRAEGCLQLLQVLLTTLGALAVCRTCARHLPAAPLKCLHLQST